MSVIAGDCLRLLRKMPAASVDFILTDPPYNISQQTKYEFNSGLDMNFGEWDVQWEDERDYLNWCARWIRQCARILKKERHFVFFFDWSLFYPIREIAAACGLRARQPLWWIKSNPVPRLLRVDFMKSHEMAFWFTKGKSRQQFFNASLGQHLDYVTAAVPHAGRVHPTQKAEEPLRVWMRYLSQPDDLVLDPFCGSGAIGRVAKQEGRQYLGFEADPVMAEVARQRVEQWYVPLGDEAEPDSPLQQRLFEELP